MNNIFRKLTNNIGAVILIAILGLILLGATYVNVGPTTNFGGDVGVPSGSGYYIDDVEIVKYSKFDATSAPTANNDIDEGYAVGSIWVDVTNDKAYVCLDNTDGAAVWTETTGSGGGASTFLDLSDTPASYTGQAGLFAKVNAGETALEFIAAGGGESNTASNIGAEVEIYKQKTGVDLEFRTLKADSNKITVSTTVPPSSETLRPNLAGDLTELTKSGDTANYLCVDEVTKDELTTYVYRNGSEKTDLYNITDSSGSGVINSVTVYAWINVGTPGYTGNFKLKIKTHATVYTDTNYPYTSTDWYLHSKAYTTNPNTGSAWTWDEVDALQIGLSIEDTSDIGRCTQMYAVISYAGGDSDYVKFDVAESNIKLDDLGTPDDNTDLNASTTAHGLLPKLDNDDTHFLDGKGTWSPSGAYTNLTSFVDQTAWRVFYSNTAGDVTELALGADGTYLKSNGAAAAPTFASPAGGGDMLKSVYDTGEDGIIDPAAGGTGVANNAANTITFTGNYSLGLTLGANTALTLPASGTVATTSDKLSDFAATTSAELAGVISDEIGSGKLVFDTSPTIASPTITGELGGELDAGAHSIGFTQQTVTYNATTTTVNWTLGNKATVTLTGNVGTLAFTNPTNPCNVLLKIVQDATGSRVVTAWDADIKWSSGGTAPTLSTGANAIDIISAYFDGQYYYAMASLDFQ